ncbi:MAG: hypothetical protein GVY32_11165 [Gammaproteobacteria bacterium]|jgi:hypothetical protein|nr:hypothetical protein [Gammaproteobacteria bacterium]
MPVLIKRGKLDHLRVNHTGSGFGPPDDSIDAEIIVHMEGHDGYYGVQLRDDGERLTHRAMLDLLRDAFNNGWRVQCDVSFSDEQSNGIIIRTMLNK